MTATEIADGRTVAAGADGVHATHCRVCPTGCGVLVEVVDGRAIRLLGDPHDPLSEGYTCGKGRASVEMHYAPDRLDVPLVRSTTGALVPTSWPAVTEKLADHLRCAIDTYGPDSIGAYRGGGWVLDPAGMTASSAFLRAIGTTQLYSAFSIDCPSKMLIPYLMSGVAMIPQADMANTQLLLFVGVNPIVSHGHATALANPLVRLRRVQARGGRIVVIDPRRTETAQMADLHVPIRAGTDPAMLAMLVRDTLVAAADTAYLHETADPASVNTLRAAVAPFDIEHTADICGVPVTMLDQLVDIIRSTGRLSVESGTGATMAGTANVTDWLVWALSAVTGSLDRKGGSLFNPGLMRPLEDSLPSDRSGAGPRARSRPELPRLTNGELACAVLADEILAGNLRTLFVLGGNPALQFPATPKLRHALQQLDELIVLDVAHTETTALATTVLPVTGPLERDDLHTGYLQGVPYLRYTHAVVPPVAARRGMWEVFVDLGRLLDRPVMASAMRRAEAAGRPLDDEIILEQIASAARVPWESLRAAPHGVIDNPFEPGWVVPGRLRHPLDLAPTSLVEQLKAWTRTAVTAPSDGVVLIPRRLSRQSNSIAPPTRGAGGDRHGPTLLVHPVDAEAHGLTNGTATLVRSAHGEVRAIAEVTDRIGRGTVSLTHGVGAVDVNQLTSDADVDATTGMPRFSGFAVSLCPADALPELVPAG